MVSEWNENVTMWYHQALHASMKIQDPIYSIKPSFTPYFKTYDPGEPYGSGVWVASRNIFSIADWYGWTVLSYSWSLVNTTLPFGFTDAGQESRVDTPSAAYTTMSYKFTQALGSTQTTIKKLICDMMVYRTSDGPGSAVAYAALNPPKIATAYYIQGGGGGEQGGSVSSKAYMPLTTKKAGEMVTGDPLLILDMSTYDKTKQTTVGRHKLSVQRLLTLVSESGIKLTCSDNTPLTLKGGLIINSTQALGVELPVQDENGFRWEKITNIIEAGNGEVMTIECFNQCYAAGDEAGKYIFTHNVKGI